jgi:hypothetical protein
MTSSYARCGSNQKQEHISVERGVADLLGQVLVELGKRDRVPFVRQVRGEA